MAESGLTIRFSLRYGRLAYLGTAHPGAVPARIRCAAAALLRGIMDSDGVPRRVE